MSNIHVIHGEVPELIDRETDQLIDHYLDNEPKDDFNYVKYNLYEVNIHTIIEEALTLPLFSNKKVIVVQNSFVFTGEKPPKDYIAHTDALQAFIEKYDGEALLIFQVQSVKLDEKKKLVKTLKKHASIKKIEQMSEQEMLNWIKTYLNTSYKEIKQDALEHFLSLTGVQYRVIKQELDKLLLFVGERPVINKNDIQMIVNRSLEQNVFLLTEYIQKGQKDKAIQLIKDLIQLKEEPIKLLALITSNYRLYYQTKILSQKGYSGQQIAKTVGAHPYRVKLALNQVKRYQLESLLSIIDRCAETDYKLKSSYMDKVLILELFILSL
ncbi:MULTISPECIES: DNA polymerase III subunit delta [Staphylococcus]|uniref:DNA polymerase III subunit delta n=1 Tax=Staphylococcus schleiferi TaxID=1295 RepID=A0A7Z7VX12_STASC|nr:MULTISPECIES: DNA polymerase III subunit delta [Staphylococcus]QGS45537.1 DNA polymerase III subunit delta [Mammaliicoccus fleurettii]EPD51844.1 DNA polymerase III, delta subunit [Staphylococcus sp. HGB0015]NHA34415.1 DNA polymerase III subunit delta [Staphylococcus schleiferi]NHA39053.1 DNA polymerase III subunit delta [Staphylococcus schleiferi]NHA41352.1 DNA polymerase III subunit delta [Staphylococcus schleiferi]